MPESASHEPSCLPGHLQIGPYTVAMIVDQNTITEIKRQVNTDRLAQWEPVSLRIVIDPSQAPGQMRESVLHEVLHAVCSVVGGLPSGDDEEAVVGRISATLLDTLRRNPALVTFLLDRESSTVSIGCRQNRCSV